MTSWKTIYVTTTTRYRKHCYTFEFL